MSGRKQHYISVYFQKGWSNNPKKRNGRIYAFEKDKSFPTNTNDNFAVNDFHSTPENPETDRLITEEIEPINNEIIKTLRDLKFNEKMEIVDENLISDINYLLISMYYLTESFRKHFFDFLEKFKSAASNQLEFFINKEILISILENNNFYDITNEEKEEMKNNIESLTDILIEMIRNFLNIFNIEDCLYIFLTLSKDNVKRSLHSEFITNRKIFDIIKSRKVFILKANEELILSDNLITTLNNENSFSFCFESKNTIFFPISSNKIIIIKNDTPFIPNDINEMLAKTSTKRIIGKNQNHQYLKKYIGKNSHPKLNVSDFLNFSFQEKYIECIESKEDIFKKIDIKLEKYELFLDKFLNEIISKKNEIENKLPELIEISESPSGKYSEGFLIETLKTAMDYNFKLKYLNKLLNILKK